MHPQLLNLPSSARTPQTEQRCWAWRATGSILSINAEKGAWIGNVALVSLPSTLVTNDPIWGGGGRGEKVPVKQQYCLKM